MQEPICCVKEVNCSDPLPELFLGGKKGLFSPFERNLPFPSLLGCAVCAKEEGAEASGGSFARANCSESEGRATVD